MTAAAKFVVLAALIVRGAADPTVHIVQPADGATVAGPSVHVVLEASGVEIAPVAEQRAGTGHLHLLLDVDATPAGQPIPAGAGIVHLGGGQTEYTFDSVGVGKHRLIAVLGDLKHVPWTPPTADTVHFTVGSP